MKRILCMILLAPSGALAAAFERPTPQPQTGVAEFWFLVASVALVLSLGVVQYLVNRR